MFKELKNLLDWIYKKRCYFCKSSRCAVKMCDKCYEEMDFLPVKINRVIEAKKVYCCGVYNKNLQKLIRGLKYHQQKDLAYYQARFMAEYWHKITNDNNFIVVPVPIFSKREKQRKYNHMNKVAEEFCRLTGNDLGIDIIKRIKDTKPQYKLTRAQRMINLQGAFKIEKSIPKDSRILIIDDICTTGSTFEEMIKEFAISGVTDIICLATTTPFED